MADLERTLDSIAGRTLGHGRNCLRFLLRLRYRMKTLFLIRHAKSSWDDTALADNDRPLNARGKRDAPKMGKRLAKRGVKPDLILSSPATRALKTAEIIAKKLDYRRKNIVVDDRLYAVEADQLLDVIRKLGDRTRARHANWPQPRVDRTRASPIKRDHPPADVRRRRVHVRCEIVVTHRKGQAHKGYARLSKVIVTSQLANRLPYWPWLGRV